MINIAVLEHGSVSGAGKREIDAIFGRPRCLVWLEGASILDVGYCEIEFVVDDYLGSNYRTLQM